MNDDRLEGAASTIGGRIESGVGEAIGDRTLQSEGVIEKARGTGQNLFGGAAEVVRSAIDPAPSEDLGSHGHGALMNQDRIEGAATTLGGRLEATVGEALGDRKLQSDGFIDKARGSAQNLFGGAQDAVRSALDQTPPEVRDGAEQAIAAVRKNPIIAALAVGAVGLVIGRFWGGTGRSNGAAHGRSSRSQREIAEEALTLKQTGERR